MKFITDQPTLERRYAKLHPQFLADHIPTWELNGNDVNVRAAKAVLLRGAKRAASALGRIAGIAAGRRT